MRVGAVEHDVLPATAPTHLGELAVIGEHHDLAVGEDRFLARLEIVTGPAVVVIGLVGIRAPERHGVGLVETMGEVAARGACGHALSRCEWRASRHVRQPRDRTRLVGIYRVVATMGV